MNAKSEEELLTQFKQGLLDVENSISDTEEYFGLENTTSEKEKKYYLRNLKYNLFNFEEPSFALGRGAEAVRSSAAMIYNTIGSRSVQLENRKYKVIKYEDELTGLKGRTKPHLDVTLYSPEKNERIFIEAKCLEWLSSPEKLASSYLNKENYCSDEEADFFIAIFKMLIDDSDKSKDEDGNIKYGSIYKRYNSKQMAIHILGIYHWCKENKSQLPKTIRLMNVVWDYKYAEEYQIEEKEGLEFVSFANLAFRNLFKELNVNFKVEYIRYSEFLNRIDWTNDEKRRDYLRRYEFAGKRYMKNEILNEGLEEKVKGYDKDKDKKKDKYYTLSKLRETANKYKWDDLDIEDRKRSMKKFITVLKKLFRRM